MKKILSTLLIFCTLMLIGAPPALASESSSFNVSEFFRIEGDNGTNITNFFINNSNKDISPTALVVIRVIDILILLVGTFGFIMLIIGGFMFITAGGEESQVDRGKALINQSIFGIIIAFLSYFIVSFVSSFFYQ